MNYENEIKQLKERIELLEKIVMTDILNKEIKKIESKELQGRDKTKFLFNGKIYAKNRLVLAVIKEYVEQNSCTFEKLKKTFDKSLQGSRNVVEELSNAQKMSDGPKRYFMKDEDIIKLIDGNMVVVCTQWGVFNIERFITCAKALGFKIEFITK